MRTTFALITAALLCAAAPVLGQQSSGDTELQLQGNVHVGGSGDQDSGSVNGRLGRFFTDYQEIGLDATGTFQADGKFGGSGGAFYRYNFSTGNIVPYLGASAGSTFGQGQTSTIAKAEAGVRFFVDRKTAFTVETTKTYFFKTKEYDKGLTIQFGFSHLWGK